MSVVIETTLGDITVDLYLEQRPATCLNFLKLCKMKYYNFNLFHTIRSGFIAQTGDPTGEGSGGESIWGLLEGSSKRFFSGEKMPKIRHTDAGLLSMVCTDDMMVGSQFFFTLAPDLDSLDGVHCVIGEVTEGHEVLTKLNEVICDETHRPYQDVRITHTVILEDPFNDLPGLRAPSRSPSPNAKRLRGGRIAPDEEIDETQGKSHAEIQEMIEEKEAKARATILEIVGDLPDADIAPPENVLFVCKLNPVTTDDDLEIIFSRFGKIVSCEVIRDKKTGDSLQYAFIEFEDKKSCEDAYFKMDNVLIDDRRIHVDFSQSVSKMRWLGKGRGVQYFNDKDHKPPSPKHSLKIQPSRERNDNRRPYHKERENNERDDRNNRYSNDSHNNFRRERKRSRSKSRRDSPNNRYTENNRNKRQDYSRESRTERSDRNISVSNSKGNENINRNNYSQTRKNELRKPSPSRHNARDCSSSPIRREERKESKTSSQREERDNNKVTRHDRDNSKSHKKHDKQTKHHSNHKERHSKDISNSKKEYKRSEKSGRHDIEPRTPSPELKKNNKSNRTEKFKSKDKNNVKKNKNKRKHSTSSSESESSDSSSSTSQSSSSSGGGKRKRTSKKRRKPSSSSSSSSSSSTSSSSSSSSSDSSSESSSSSSDSEHNKKRHKKNEDTKSSKNAKKRKL